MHRFVHSRVVSRSLSRAATPALGVALAFGLAGAGAGTLAAQEAESGGFEPDRALLSDTTRWRPFDVSETQPLAEALAEGQIHDDTPLLVFEGPAGPVALLVEQMAYHHVAQGEMAGEPWMVSF
ncbi:MAG: hypothetical protein GWN99_08690 [Gemmatimonadetes bacterium]|uniref:DUF3179 domain-containing protein n=1 Tax=Candidatus Kutchimonas denitrificans TaxID=3056748 RepID=A0AAE5CDV1_9BACT|nr:hypothetical protein [Gemmatimonadota bacterium]NIR76574.1 hypothetical protein [Candidatus Kutchimonas denitrificans]NIS01130.1 hypothetical protein [Gemmatimonadota bacterium]NIT66897.1 hypothetical protein [Gemmatimonadota bacterium]NIU54670.1 hypothetical protein [Gemmatimonadota bacterium]